MYILHSRNLYQPNYFSQVNKDLPENEQVPIFPFSYHYVFYEQYLTMWTDALVMLSISLVAILVVCLILLGCDFRSAAIIFVIIIMIIVSSFSFTQP